jgi:hypothetical protein
MRRVKRIESPTWFEILSGGRMIVCTSQIERGRQIGCSELIDDNITEKLSDSTEKRGGSLKGCKNYR